VSKFELLKVSGRNLTSGKDEIHWGIRITGMKESALIDCGLDEQEAHEEFKKMKDYFLEQTDSEKPND